MLLLFIKAKIKLPDDSMLLSLKKTHKPNKTKSTNQKKKKTQKKPQKQNKKQEKTPQRQQINYFDTNKA